MKKIFLIGLMLLSSSLFGQTRNDITMSLLKWLVKREHVEYLKIKSNAAVFYHKDFLTKQTVIDSSEKDIPNLCLKNFLSPAEIQICKTVPSRLMQTDWSKKYPRLKIKFVTDKSEIKMFTSNIPYTIYSFSDPVFLNESNTRAVIAEYFVCGPACGRDDLLLCEYKNDSWQIIARAVIAND